MAKSVAHVMVVEITFAWLVLARDCYPGGSPIAREDVFIDGFADLEVTKHFGGQDFAGLKVSGAVFYLVFGEWLMRFVNKRRLVSVRFCDGCLAIEVAPRLWGRSRKPILRWVTSSSAAAVMQVS